MSHGAMEIRDNLKKGMTKVKTAAQMDRESIDTAKALPMETKKKFWNAIRKDGKNLGEAREIAGIDDIMVAAQLVILCHTKIHIPMSVDDIK